MAPEAFPAPLRQRRSRSSVRQIRDVLRADILSGRHRPGRTLPSEADLMVALAASRTAVRGALDLLRDEGLIERHPRTGTSVVAAKSSHGLDKLRGLAESFEGGPGRVVNEVIGADVIPAGRLVADRLQLAAGEPVVYIERLRHLDGAPLSLDTSYLPVDVGAPLLDVDLTTLDIFAVLDGPLGFRLGAAALSIEAVPADSSVAALLDLAPGWPLLLVDRLTSLEDGRPVDLEFLRYRGDRLSLTTELTRSHLEDR